MCGISGFYSINAFDFNNVILKMSSALSHRGPDSSRTWKDKNSGIIFGHQRLSILDLTKAGDQPMFSKSKRFVITFNGEIYNHLEIRNKLAEINSNIKWKSGTDTETLLEAIEILGIKKTLEIVVGMFAFVIWDKKNRALTLVRDRMGEKPLYYGWQGTGKNKVFLFGSELKALKPHPLFTNEINRDAIALQLRHNYIPDPYSIYKDIYKLLPGHYLHLREKDLKNGLLPKVINYWSLMKCAIEGNMNQLPLNGLEIQNDLEDHLKLSVKQQMISDVPTGAFLSGGIDSSTIVSLMQSQSNKQIKTFTIGFSKSDFNEAKYAKKIAKHLGTDHTELYFSTKTAMQVIPKLPTIHDEPFSDNSQIPSFLLSQLAKKQIRVALSGDGGDELFCGYNRYNSTNSWSNKFNLIPNSIRKILADRIKATPQDALNRLLNLLPNLNDYASVGYKTKSINALKAKTLADLYHVILSQSQNPSDVVLRSKEPATFLTKLQPKFPDFNNHQIMMALDQITYLPNDILVKVDRTSMASSIETRVPFLIIE